MQLFIDTYGTYIHVKDEMFEIRVREDGEVQKHHYSARKVSHLMITLGTAISSDAVKLAVDHNIDILFADRNGSPVGRVWHSKLGSTSTIRKEQLMASMNKTGLEWIKTWINKKINNQIDFIKDLKKHRQGQHDFLDRKISGLEEKAESISNIEAESAAEVADRIRGIEGTCGRLYFETLSTVLPKKHQFDGRSYRPARDPFNAFLNYAYGIMYSKIEKALIVAGIDPYIGFLHRDNYNQVSFVFDFIEPYRIFAEKVVFRLFSGKKVKTEHTEEITNGYSLNKAGKELLVPAFNKYMDEDKVRYKNKNQSRSNIIQSDAHAFANSLIKDKKTETEIPGFPFQSQ
jgi:CRISPR-associated protein Cas1